jgi:hypothetical protein
MHNATIYSVEPSSAKLDGPVSKTEGSIISSNSDEPSETMMADPDHRRTPLVCYLENPDHIANTKVWR